MEALVKTLRTFPNGYGFRRISMEYNGNIIETVTNNMMAVDVAVDENYDYEDNSGRFYETRHDAQTELVNEILRANDIEL